jgi:hypothetical protein
LYIEYADIIGKKQYRCQDVKPHHYDILRGAFPAVTKKSCTVVNAVLTMPISASASFGGCGARIKVGFIFCTPKKILNKFFVEG